MSFTDDKYAHSLKQLERIETQINSIASLKYEPINQGEEGVDGWRMTQRKIITADGEVVGSLRTIIASSGWDRPRYRFSSPRIPYNNRRDYRDYTIPESVVAAIVKFCMPVSKDEGRAKVLRKEISYYQRRVSEAWNRTRGVLKWRGGPNKWHPEETAKADYTQPRFDLVINGLASRDPEAKAEAEALLRALVNKKRVYDKFSDYVDFVYLNGRQAEMARLDLSNETIHNT